MSWQNIIPWIAVGFVGALIGAIITLWIIYRRSMRYLASQRPIPRSMEECLSDIYDKIENRTNNRSLLLAGILAIFFGAFYFQYAENLRGIKEEMQARADDHEKKLNFETSKTIEELNQQALQRFSAFENVIRERIDKEFKTDNISLLIEKGAKDRVDLITDKILEDMSFDFLEPRLTAFSTQIQEIGRSAEYANLILGCKRGERAAFDKLLVIADDKLDLRNSMAKTDALLVAREYSTDPYLKQPFSGYTWHRLGVNESDLDIRAMYDLYIEHSLLSERSLFIAWVWPNARFDHLDKIDVMVDILRHDTYVGSMSSICHNLDDILEVKLGGLINYKKYIETWDANKERLRSLREILPDRSIKSPPKK